MAAPNLPLFLPVAFLLLAAAPAPSAAEKFVVGGKKNWAANVNYTTWPDQYRFHVGDWLQFNYARDMYDVVQVADAAAYDKCDASKPLVKYDRGRGFVFQLNHTGRYYFICSRGYCWSGMKVTVLVEESPAQPPQAAAPSPNAAARHGVVAWAVAAAAASLCAAVLGLPFAVWL
ncbi:lamin-like protein [Triticum urartu]|uniref:Phytocyanin domain-containing protein n=1 Tax=Triticum urartu TaxID=4572 RepID=A0A8R7TXN1_TRIUA|nr:lamin-like protein [Triticum urartu]